MQLYVLVDPRDGDIRYVGVTARSLAKRLQGHLSDSCDCHRTRWIRSLARLGERPIIRQLAVVPASYRDAAEKYWIAFFRAQGCRLVNRTDGGGGSSGLKMSEHTRLRMRESRLKAIRDGRVVLKGRPGHQHTPESRAKISTANKGRVRTPEQRLRMSKAFTGVKRSDKARAEMSERRKGVPKTPEHAANIAAALRGKPKSAEHRAKLSKAAKKRHSK